MNVLSLLANDNYIIVNKDIVKELGIIEAIILGEIASEYTYWNKRDMIDEEGYFYSTIENVKENTSLSQYQQSNALNALASRGLVSVKRKGVPAKRYIKLHEQAILNMLDNKILKNLTTGCEEISSLDSKNFDINNNKENINNNNNKKDTIPYTEIIMYLNNRTGASYRATSKKTRDLIKARFNEGFTLDDFKVVIDKKSDEWLDDKNMSKFLRPETLFGTKFESYLNQPSRKMTTKDLAKGMDFGFMGDVL